jgi:hypothetical protein
MISGVQTDRVSDDWPAALSRKYAVSLLRTRRATRPADERRAVFR